MGKKCFPLIYNLYLTLGVFLSVNFGNHRAAPITRGPIADSPDEITTMVLSSAERKYGFHFLFILAFWRLFRNNFPRYTVVYSNYGQIENLEKYIIQKTNENYLTWFQIACKDHRLFLLRKLVVSRVSRGLKWESIDKRQTNKRSHKPSKSNDPR